MRVIGMVLAQGLEDGCAGWSKDIETGGDGVEVYVRDINNHQVIIRIDKLGHIVDVITVH